MPVDCQRTACGGKGNLGMFYDRSPQICAAGLPTQQPDDSVGTSLSHYLLKDAADALFSDVILPDKEPRPLLPLRHQPPRDTRFAGKYGEVPELINPPLKTKFQILVDEMKSTVYSSYWKKPLGTVPDAKHNLPEGFDYNQALGIKTPFHGSLYDIVMPKEPIPDKTPVCQKPGMQKKYSYCEPFSTDLTYGYRTGSDIRGSQAKCALTDDRVKQGSSGHMATNTAKSNFLDENQPRLGRALEPYENISCVPKGYTFGKLNPPDNLTEVLPHFPLNPDHQLFMKCMKHLNCLRISLSKHFLPTFFRQYYLNLKYFDVEKSGWLPKKVVYDDCAKRSIVFEPALMEPLLSLCQAFDGSRIKYKTYVNILNYREPLPDMPKVLDFPAECLDFRTTYTEMIKPVEELDNTRIAGVPSTRYFDIDYPETPRYCCLADRTYLSQETDVKACLNPSVMALVQVNHRHMYAVREPEVVRRVFEASGETFTDESFDAVWEKAKKFHPQGWVCYETFRRALEGDEMGR